MKNHSQPPILCKKLGFTLIELLVVVAIILILGGLLFPFFSAIVAKSRSIQCLSNLKQLGAAQSQFSADNNMMNPHVNFWPQELSPYVLPAGQPDITKAPLNRFNTVFHCPAANPKELYNGLNLNSDISYGQNGDWGTPTNAGSYFSLLRLASSGNQITNSTLITYLDGLYYNIFDNGPSRVPTNRHSGGAVNACFADGHVESITTNTSSTYWMNLFHGFQYYP